MTSFADDLAQLAGGSPALPHAWKLKKEEGVQRVRDALRAYAVELHRYANLALTANSREQAEYLSGMLVLDKLETGIVYADDAVFVGARWLDRDTSVTYGPAHVCDFEIDAMWNVKRLVH